MWWYITNVQISDNNYYKNKWLNYDDVNNDNPDGKQYSFLNSTKNPFTLPISIKITKSYQGNIENITNYNIITQWTPLMTFDFGINFCRNILTETPTSQPTSVLYGVTISITFEYIARNDTNLTSLQIEEILTNITSDIISSAIPLDTCIKRDGYNIIVTEKQNGTEITAEITTCDQQTQQIVITSLNDYDLENEIINKTMPYILIAPSTIKLDVSIISEPLSTAFQSTLLNVFETMDNIQDGIDKNDGNFDFVMVVIIIICSLLVIIVCIMIIYFVKFRRKTEMKNRSEFRVMVKSFSHSPRSGISRDIVNNNNNNNIDNKNDIMTPTSEIALAMVQMAIDNDNKHKNDDDEEKDDIYIDNPGTNIDCVMDDNIATNR